MSTNSSNDIDQRIQAINQRLQELEEEKSRLLARKAQLESTAPNLIASSSTLSSKDKVSLFQNFFSGREDIYAFRWENNAGKSGYAVACHNEWQPDLCQKTKNQM